MLDEIRKMMVMQKLQTLTIEEIPMFNRAFDEAYGPCLVRAACPDLDPMTAQPCRNCPFKSECKEMSDED